MKKIFIYTLIAMMAVLGTSCNSCRHQAEPTDFVLNYDETVIGDYDCIASQYDSFYFYEADVLFDSILSVEGNRTVISIHTVFQCGDTCIEITHADGKTDTTRTPGFYCECMPMDARNAVGFDSCMLIIESYRQNLNTRAMTFRRVLAPPFPKNGQYIFGAGILVVDSKTGEIVDWDSKAVKNPTMSPKKP